MKIEKIMKTFAITVIAIGSIFTFSQTTEAATISIEKAAEKIYKAETKAYNIKKDVSVTVKLASKSSRNAIRKVIENMEDVLIKKELGDEVFTDGVLDNTENAVLRTRWIVDKEIPIFKGEDGREYVERLI